MITGLRKKVCLSVLDKVIKTSSRIAITISEKDLIKVLAQYPSIDSPSSFRVEN